MDLQTMLEKIDQLQKGLDGLPKNSGLTAKERDHLNLQWTYNSNAIEGSTLSIRDTQLIREGVSVGGKAVREILEVINHERAIHEVEKMAQSQSMLQESDIKRLHGFVLRTIDDTNAGAYRLADVMVVGAVFRPPQFYKIKDRMAGLVHWYQQPSGQHSVLKATELHTRFVRIHPFIDGNGRTAWLLMNYELMKNGLPPAVITVENRAQYYESLRAADLRDDHAPLAIIICESLIPRMESMLQQKPGNTQKMNPS